MADDSEETPDQKTETYPISCRFTKPQIILLDEFKGALSRTDYIRLRTIGAEAAPVRTRVRYPVQDYQAYATLLAKLGQSHLSSNLNQLARQANIGTLIVTPETEAALVWAAQELSEMRHLLIKVTGLEVIP